MQQARISIMLEVGVSKRWQQPSVKYEHTEAASKRWQQASVGSKQAVAASKWWQQGSTVSKYVEGASKRWQLVRGSNNKYVAGNQW